MTTRELTLRHLHNERNEAQQEMKELHERITLLELQNADLRDAKCCMRAEMDKKDLDEDKKEEVESNIKNYIYSETTYFIVNVPRRFK